MQRVRDKFERFLARCDDDLYSLQLVLARVDSAMLGHYVSVVVRLYPVGEVLIEASVLKEKSI